LEAAAMSSMGSEGITIVLCPECGSKMHRMGKTWSGRKQVQRYRCPKCGRTYAPVDKRKED